MQSLDRIMRMAAFYFSVALFLALLPIVLSYALGYKIDYSAFKIYKTGILHLNSNPAGAAIYINGRLNRDATPAQIEELKPGTYKVEIRREGFYPWEMELLVRPNMVTRADRIVLFPVKQDMKVLSEQEVMDFTVSDNNYIYFFSKNGLFRVGVDGSGLKRISSHSVWPDGRVVKKFSPDGTKILLYSDNKIWVIYLTIEKTLMREAEEARVEEIFTSGDQIMDVFWYSQSTYLVVVTCRDIKVVELKGGDRRNIALLYKFTIRPRGIYYDEDRDALYFTDAGKGTDSGGSTYLYKLDLRQKYTDSLLKLLLKRDTEAEYESK